MTPSISRTSRPVLVACRRRRGRGRRAARRSGVDGPSPQRPLPEPRVDDLLDRVADQRERRSRAGRCRCRAARSTTMRPAPPRQTRWPCRASCPRTACVGSPRPRNDSVDSDRIEMAMISTVLAKISGSTLGRICLRRTHGVRAPSARDRSTNVRSLVDSTWLRMIRDVPAQPVIPMTMMMIPSLPPGQFAARLLEQRHQHDRERQERDHQEPVVDRGQDVVDPAAEEAGDDADDAADDGRDDAPRRRRRPARSACRRTSSEKMSRPVSSVPSGCSGCSDGGAIMSLEKDVAELGSCGAIHGAKIATSTKKTSRISPTMPLRVVRSSASERTVPAPQPAECALRLGECDLGLDGRIDGHR